MTTVILFNLVRHQQVAEFHLQYCNICVLKRVDNALLYLQPRTLQNSTRL